MFALIKSFSFYIAIGIDIIAILIAFYFIITDAIRRSSSSNGTLSLITFAMCGWVALCWYLKLHNSPGLASTLAWIPALPLGLYGLMILLFIILKPDMK